MGPPENINQHGRNFRQMQPFVGKTITPIAVEAIRHFTNEFYARNEQLFPERIAQHRILDCHGDLHLDHVHITPDAVTIFDSIEFNDRSVYRHRERSAFLAIDFDFERITNSVRCFLRRAAEHFAIRILKLAQFP